MKASYANILSGALRALVAAGALTAVSLFLYLMAFNQFKWYDDEGFLMLTQQGFNQGHALYDDIFTQYGPFSYILRDLIYRAIPDLSVTHDANRMISLITTVRLTTHGRAATDCSSISYDCFSLAAI